jgi:hypothetical protein
MKRRNIRKAIGVLAVGLLAIPVWAAGNAQRLRVPQDTPLPMYVVGLAHTGLEADDWVVTAFYYPSDTVPPDYDLFNEPVWAYPVGAVTPLVEGFLVFHDGNPAPVPQVVKNAPGANVEIWFTPVQNFANGVGPYPPFTWTVNSMKAEGSIVGYADSFTQAWPAGTPNNPNNTVVASGVMEDGRKFWLRSTYAIGGAKGVAAAPYCIVHFGP